METDIGANAQETAAPAGFNDSSGQETPSENMSGSADRNDAWESDRSMPQQDRSAARAARIRERAEGEQRLRALVDRQNAFARSQGYGDFAAMVRGGAAPQGDAARQNGAYGPDALDARLESIVDRRMGQNPVMRAVQQIAEQTAVEDNKRILDGEMREFMATPEYAKSGIRTFADFTGMPGFDRFYDLVARKGLTLSEAYELVNRQSLLRDRAEAARQAALNRVNGKAHLRPAEGGGEDLGSVAVPEDVMDYYRQMTPKMTRRQVEDHYSEFLRNQTS